MGYYTGKKILIIGGTGSIGQGLTKKLLQQNPQVIRILSRDEYKQFIMEKQMENTERIRFLIGDIRDYERVERAMSEIDIVFNLAAMKHVPACEYNPFEAVKTNIIGVENVIKAARTNNVDSVIFTSSDKAINPSNTYGATKLLGEKIVQTASYSQGNPQTRFVAVRFGNVMGSRGSVIPLFKKQIEINKKITVTDPEMTRFMMTLSQAVNLIMEAPIKSIGGEVFILKMPVIRLYDLAQVVVEETCLKLNIKRDDVEIQTIGLRAGERRFEELMTKEESYSAFDLGNMYSVISSINSEFLLEFYEKYKRVRFGSYNSNDEMVLSKEEVRTLLNEEALV